MPSPPGLGIAAEELQAPVGTEFKRVYDQQNFGMSMQDALRAMARRVPVLDARFFVTAVLTQRESGGNLAEVLDNLSSVMRERFKVKRQIRVISAHGRLSGWILSLVPPSLAAFLFFIQPNFMRILVDDPIGIRLVMAAIVLQLLGTYIISRLVKIEYDAMDLQLTAMLAVLFVSVACAAGAGVVAAHRPAVDASPAHAGGGRCRRHCRLQSVVGDAPSALAQRARVVRAQVAEGDEPRPADDGAGGIPRRLAGHAVRVRPAGAAGRRVLDRRVLLWPRYADDLLWTGRGRSPISCRICGLAARSSGAAPKFATACPTPSI